VRNSARWRLRGRSRDYAAKLADSSSGPHPEEGAQAPVSKEEIEKGIKEMSAKFRAAGAEVVTLLLAAHLLELGEQSVVLGFEIQASLPAYRLGLLLVARGEMRLELRPPAIVELRPFLAAQHGAGLWDVAVGDE